MLTIHIEIEATTWDHAELALGVVHEAVEAREREGVEDDGQGTRSHFTVVGEEEP
jgi:hypothetical protein